jgi:hypothetical protein
MIILAAIAGACAGERAPEAPGAGDGPDSPKPCAVGVVGDGTLPPELQVLTLGPGINRRVIEDGDGVALVLPPQGGRIVLAGVRARNLDPCGVSLTGFLRDGGSGQVRLDGRTVNLRLAADGWAESDGADLAAFANVPVCPNEWASIDLSGGRFDLTVEVQDRAGRTGSRSIGVVPSCTEVETPRQCACSCRAGYMLGQPCPAD